jgi:hypothetical protein
MYSCRSSPVERNKFQAPIRSNSKPSISIRKSGPEPATARARTKNVQAMRPVLRSGWSISAWIALPQVRLL